jgi:hypothetical protein
MKIFDSIRIPRGGCVALVLAVLGAAYPNTEALADGQNAVLTWPDVSGFTGNRIRVTLSVANPDSVQSALIDVTYDPALVTPDPLSLLQEPYGQSIQAAWGASTPTSGTLRLVFATADPDGYTGAGGDWVSIEFDMIGAGVSPLHFDIIALERLPNRVIPSTGDDGSISVSPAAVDPATWGRVKGLYSEPK